MIVGLLFYSKLEDFFAPDLQLRISKLPKENRNKWIDPQRLLGSRWTKVCFETWRFKCSELTSKLSSDTRFKRMTATIGRSDRQKLFSMLILTDGHNVRWVAVRRISIVHPTRTKFFGNSANFTIDINRLVVRPTPLTKVTKSRYRFDPYVLAFMVR